MRNKISKKLLSFLLTIAMVFSMIPFGSIPFVQAVSTNLSNFTNNTSLKVYAYYTDDTSDRWKSSVDPNIEYVASATDTKGTVSTIWGGTSSYLNRICNGINTDYFLPNFPIDMKARTTTVVLDLGAWYNIDSVKLEFLQGGNSRLSQYPTTVYYSSASTIEEVRDYGFKSFYGTTKLSTTVTSTTALTITKSASMVRFVAIDYSALTIFRELDWQTGPKLSEVTVTGDYSTKTTLAPNYSSVTSVSVANMPTSFNLGEDAYNALAKSGAVIKDQSGNTLTSVFKFEGLHTSTTGTRKAVAWVGPETSSINVPSTRKTTFNYTVNTALNNVALNQTYSSGAMEPQMGLYGGANSGVPFALFTSAAASNDSSNVKAYSPITALDLTTYYPFTSQALSETLDNSKALTYGVGNGAGNTSVASAPSTDTLTNGTLGNYAVIDLQNDYDIRMVQFTAAQNVIKPKLYYLTEAEGTNIITGGQKVVGRASAPPVSAPYAATETFNASLLKTAVAEITAVTTDLGSYNSKDTVVAFKSDASQTPALSGELSTSVNATPVVVSAPAVAATARYVIIQNQTTSANITQVGEFKIWANTVQKKLQLNKQNLNKIINKTGGLTQTNYTTTSWANFSSKSTNAQNVYNNSNATIEQVDVATYDLFDSFLNLDIRASVSEIAGLKYQIDYANALVSTNYTTISWNNLQTILASATYIFNNSTSSKEVVANTINLQNSINNLIPVGPKSNLAEAISIAQALNQNNYTPISWSTYYPTIQTALSTAITVNNNANATQLEIDTAQNNLLSAIENLVEQPLEIETTVSKATTMLNDTFEVTVNLKNYSQIKSSIGALQIELDYDTSLFTYVSESGRNELVLPMDTDNTTSVGGKAFSQVVETNKAYFVSAYYANVNSLGVFLSLPKTNTTVMKFTLKTIAQVSADTSFTFNTRVVAVTDDSINSKDISFQTLQQPTINIKYVNPNIVEKSVLKTVLDSASTKIQDDYTPNSWAPFNTEISNAQQVYADPNATQQTVDNAKTALTSAINGLIARANFTALNAAITTALTKVQASYTTASWATFATALTTAQSVVTNLNATQAQVDSATTALVTATNALVIKPKYMLGDVNNDAKIDGKDIAAIVMHITKVKVLTNPTDLYPALTAADINGDAKVDGKDIAAIVMHITKVKPIVQPV